MISFSSLADVIRGQIDFVIFVHGLGLVLLGVACLSLSKASRHNLPWYLFGVSGLMLGMSKWLDVVGCTYHTLQILPVLGLSLQVVSYIMLLEYGRRSLAAIGKIRLGWWIYAPLIALAGAGAPHGLDGLRISAADTLGVTGLLACAWTIALMARRSDRTVGTELMRMSAATALYAIASVLFSPAVSFIAPRADSVFFYQDLDLLAQPVRMLLSVVLGCSAWRCRQLLNWQGLDASHCRARLRATKWMTAILLLVLGLGWVITAEVGRYADSRFRANLLSRTWAAASMLQPADVKALTGSSSDARTSAFSRLRSQLKRIRSINRDSRYVYLMRLRGRYLVFLADAEPTNSSSYSAPGAVYVGGTDRDVANYRRARDQVCGPYSDAWGEWVTGQVPIWGSGHRMLASLAIDMKASEWATITALPRLFCIATTLLVCSLVAALLVTIENRQEVRIAASEQKYHALISGLPDHVALFDAMGHYITVNPRGAQMMGCPEDQLLGCRFADLWDHEQRAKVDEAVEQARSGQECSFEAIYTLPGNDQRTYGVKLTPMLDEPEGAHRFVGVISDITQRTQAEEALRASEAKFRNVVEASADPIVQIDLEGMITYVSSTYTDVFGYLPSDMIGHNAESLVHPDDALTVRQALSDVMRRRIRRHVEFRSSTKDGRWLMTSASGSPSYDTSGELCGVTASLHDITDLKRMESRMLEESQRLAVTLRSIGDGVMAIDLEQRVVLLNDVAEQLTGWSSSEAVGMPFHDVFNAISDVDRSPIDSPVLQVLRTGQAVSLSNHTLLISRSGEERPISDTCAPILDADGRMTGVVLVFRDVTEQKMAEREIQCAQTFLDAVIANLPMGVNVKDAKERRVVLCNRASEQLFGRDMEDVIGRTAYEIFPEDQAAQISAAEDQVVKDGGLVEMSTVASASQGLEERIWRLYKSPIFGADGKPEYILSIGEDITQRKRAEEALQFTQFAVDTSAIGLACLTPDGAFVSVNEAFSKSMGYSREQLQSMNVFDIDLYLNHDNWIQRCNEVREKGSLVVESLLLAASGRMFPVEMRVNFVCFNGEEYHFTSVQDITERKAAEEALRASEQRYRDLVENASSIILQLDNVGQITFVNEFAQRFFGYSEDELLGHNVMGTIVPDSDGSGRNLRAMMRDLAQQPDRYQANVNENMKRSGERVWVAWANRAILDRDGEHVGILCIGNDITDRKKAEEAQRKRLARENMLASIALEAVTQEDSRTFEQNCLSAIGNALDLSRVYIAELERNSSRSMSAVEWVRDDVRPRGDRLGEAVTELASCWLQDLRRKRTIEHSNTQRCIIEAEKSALLADGVMSLLVVPLHIDRGLHGFIAFEECLSPREWVDEDVEILKTAAQVIIGTIARKRAMDGIREAHAETELVMASISSALIRTNAKLAVTEWNSVAESTFGVAAADAVGKSLFECGVEWDHSQLAQGLSDCLTTRSAVRLDDVRYVPADGRDHLLGVTISPIIDALGENTGLLLLCSDVTERRTLESQLAQAQKLESIGQIAAGIAHEISTPTQCVGDSVRFLSDGFAELLKLLKSYEQLLPVVGDAAHAAEIVERIHVLSAKIGMAHLLDGIPPAVRQSLDGIERVTRIVRAMEEFSHPGTTEKIPSDLNKAIETTVIVAGNEWKHVADVETSFDPDLPLVPCLPSDLNQVILSMLVNASHAISDVVDGGAKGKGKITISTRHDGDWAEIRISDTGTGIPENIRPKIFDPFFTTKQVGKGTGQGLAISHSVVRDKHNGTISVETEVGKGTTFIIRLPIQPEDSARRAA